MFGSIVKSPVAKTCGNGVGAADSITRPPAWCATAGGPGLVPSVLNFASFGGRAQLSGSGGAGARRRAAPPAPRPPPPPPAPPPPAPPPPPPGPARAGPCDTRTRRPPTVTRTERTRRGRRTCTTKLRRLAHRRGAGLDAGWLDDGCSVTGPWQSEAGSLKR